jgi:L-ascorbate metabolism protein UlaG (beta-lactamase superfamily)
MTTPPSKKRYDNSRFGNINAEVKPKNLIDILKWKINARQPKWPDNMPSDTDVPPNNNPDGVTRISYVGHVTFLVQAAGLNILTDPVWSDRVSPFSFIGPKRITKPGIKFDDLPKIDIILISHNHYDHLDLNTIKRLWERDQPQIIVPLLNDSILQSNITGIKVSTLNWYEKIDVTINCCISLEPAQHWSARGLFDQNKALWGTFLITTKSGSICFIGDSGYNQSIFRNLGQKYDIALSLIPIGAYEPRWFMKDIHMNPEDAVLAHQDMKSKHSIASHFDTFQLADEGFNQAVGDLIKAKTKYKISDEEFIVPSVGMAYQFPQK